VIGGLTGIGVAVGGKFGRGVRVGEVIGADREVGASRAGGTSLGTAEGDKVGMTLGRLISARQDVRMRRISRLHRGLRTSRLTSLVIQDQPPKPLKKKKM
jgi:hypothetical protein